MKLNIGSGQYPLEGYVNIDLYEPADIQGDFMEMQFEGVTEAVLSHVLEHLSWRQSKPALRLVRSWMDIGARIVVEVPDMSTIVAMGFTRDTRGAMYGDQSHEGEYHKTGFSDKMLVNDLLECGFGNVQTRRFLSTHPARDGFPCLEATAVAV